MAVEIFAQICVCGSKFEPDHQMTCCQGGFISHRHNELRDLTAALMKKICTDVSTEPELQPVSGEDLPRSANAADATRLDIRARGFWNCSAQDAFFDVRVFHPFAPTYRSSSLASIYRQHERKKKNEYGARVKEIEHGCFTPLVFSTSGGMGREATMVFKKLAALIADKSGENYSVTMGWIRSKISFSLLRSSLLCLRGGRSKGHDLKDTCIAIASAEANVRH